MSRVSGVGTVCHGDLFPGQLLHMSVEEEEGSGSGTCDKLLVAHLVISRIGIEMGEHRQKIGLFSTFPRIMVKVSCTEGTFTGSHAS